jgi:phosphoglycerol transferase MdoB-like AlkP superfamily enzyme
VYFSQNQFLNHSAVNPVFSFLSSLEKTASDIPEYHFMEEPERAALMRDIYPTVSEQPDTLLRTSRPDIVVILLESCGGIFTDDIGGRKDIMPRFNKLVDEGVYFSNFYANSYRTDRGTLCTWSGYPSFPRSSVMKMPAKTRFLPGIAKSLLKEGYHTSYIYGGDINFTNMRSYLVTIGFDQFCWMKDYTMEQQRTSKWGVRDDITFATLYDQITAPKANGTHRLIGYSTLSSHEPWDVPTHRLSEEIPNAFNYLDECLGNFIDKMRQTPQWDNLLVVLLPDHGYSYFGVDETHELHDHVPMLWLGGALRGPRRVEQFCNQTDLPATLLGQMGLPHDDYLFSRDVMSRNYTYPFAVHTYNNGITMKDSTGFAVYDLNVNRIIVDKSTDSRHLIRRGMAILQTASEHIRQLK